MEDTIDNLINGNLTDAKAKATRFSQSAIYHWLITWMEWKHERAACAAAFLKGSGSFQAYCDAERGAE